MALVMFVVYVHPKDFPEKFVVRKWFADRPTTTCWNFDTLEEARLYLAGFGLYRMDPDPSDDPCIAEIWI
jgi:hypothetical protein